MRDGGPESPNEPPPAPPRRRTQAERSASTRERVIRAVLDCVAEEGLANTTAARIAERSGVTWGAIVHQFGDKDSLLLAAHERSHGDLCTSLTEASSSKAMSPRERVSLLIDETWKRMDSPNFRAFLQIVLDNRSGLDESLKARREKMVVALTKQLWAHLFGGFGIDPRRIDTARKLTFATLLGLSIQAMIGPRRPRFTQELQTLKDTVLHQLGLEGDMPAKNGD